MNAYTRDADHTIPLTAVRLVGVGGAGCKLLRTLGADVPAGVLAIAMHTDAALIEASDAATSIHLGSDTLRGIGTAGDAAKGREAALQSADAIRAALRGSRCVFVCAGLGGGTGGGAAPIIARLARKQGAFVAGIAILPFEFEGASRMSMARTALDALAAESDLMLVLENQHMMSALKTKTGLGEAFATADQVIGRAVSAVLRIATQPGLIHLGLDDLAVVLGTGSSRCLFGTGSAAGRERGTKALREALASPLLGGSEALRNIQRCVVHLCGGEDLPLREIESVMEQVAAHLPPQTDLHFGVSIDPSMKSSLAITLIGADPDIAPQARMEEADLVHVAPPDGQPLDLPETNPIIPETAASQDEPAELPFDIPIAASATEDPSVMPSTVADPPPSLEAEPIDAARGRVKLGIKGLGEQSELSLDAVPRGRFDGHEPNLFDGEDLDLPPFLRPRK
jgi:cell division protein FtsZ